MKKVEVRKYVDDYYFKQMDITIIMADYIDLETGEVMASEITGFYYGEPSKNFYEKMSDLKYYDGKPRATFNEQEFEVVQTTYDVGGHRTSQNEV